MKKLCNLLIISFLILKTTPSVSAQDCTAQAQKLFDFANKTFHQGSPQQQAVYDSIIRLCPSFDNAYFEKSVAFLKRSDFYTSFFWLNKAVELNPKRHLGYRGWLKFNTLRDFEGAIEDLERLDTLTPNFTDHPWGDNIYYELGLCYRGLGKYERAIENFDKAINETVAVRGKDWVAPYTYLYRAYSKRDLGDIEGAIADLTLELTVNSMSAEALFHRAVLRLQQGNSAEAKLDVDKALTNYKRGYVFTDKYHEVPDQLYLSDIESFINNGYKK
jgi:tetratricopeptide (TPR) repeat protein